MRIDEIKTQYKNSILQIGRERKIDNIRVFGSVAKKTQTEKSDVDFLVHLLPEASLLDLSGFHLDLEELLKCKIDVIPDNSIHWSIKDKILSEAISIS